MNSSPTLVDSVRVAARRHLPACAAKSALMSMLSTWAPVCVQERAALAGAQLPDAASVMVRA